MASHFFPGSALNVFESSAQDGDTHNELYVDTKHRSFVKLEMIGDSCDIKVFVESEDEVEAIIKQLSTWLVSRKG